MAEIGKNITKAKQFLVDGYPVAIPTETVYGLAANALNIQAVSRVFSVKKRPLFDPLILHVASIECVDKYARECSENARKLMEAFWPGPLTLILKKKNIVPNIVTSGLNTVGIRCPRNSLTCQLLSQLSFPLAAPSANPFGYISPTTSEHVQSQLGNYIPYILDDGSSEVGVESTIVACDTPSPVLCRLGAISKSAIEDVVGTISIRQHDQQHAVMPGSLKKHYSPYKRIVLGNIGTLAKRFARKKVGALCFQHFSPTVPMKYTKLLSPSGDLVEAANRLFDSLRQLDCMDIDVILAEKAPHVGIGTTINDRLEKAAAQPYNPA